MVVLAMAFGTELLMVVFGTQIFFGWHCVHCAACAFMLATFCAIDARGTFGSRGVGPMHSSVATRAVEFVIPSNHPGMENAKTLLLQLQEEMNELPFAEEVPID